MSMPERHSKYSAWPSRISLAVVVLAYVAIFLTVFGAKLVIVFRYTMPHPYWDSWHVEGLQTYKPFLTGTYRLADLFSPASEHRPAVLRLYALALLALNGQWDVQLQMVGTAVLLGIFACLLFMFLNQWGSPLSSVLLAIGTALMLGLPVGWENNVNGHHAGWFFFYIFSIMTLWFCVGDVALSRRWWLGFGSATAAYLSLFAGVLTPLAATAGMLFRMFCERRYTRRGLAGVAGLMTLFAVGMAWENRFPGQENVKAQNVLAFLKTLSYALVWPSADITIAAFFVYMPFVVVFVLLAYRRWKPSRPLIFTVSLVFWVFLQSVGVAYARGMTGIPPVTRYLDIVGFGVLANFALLLFLLQSDWGNKRSMVLLHLAALLWIWSIGYNLDERVGEAFANGLPAKATDSFIQDALLRAYVATGDRGYIENKTSAQIAYYAGTDALAAVLNDPVLRPILPYSIREPLPITWLNTESAFRINGIPPSFPVLHDREVLGSFDAAGTTGTIESRKLPAPKFPYLEIRVAGDVGKNGLGLRLISDNGERIDVVPSQPSDQHWVSVIVPSPTAPFRIAATDSNAQGWLAFSPPREVGRASAWAAGLLSLGPVIYHGGLACLAGMLALAIVLSVPPPWWGRGWHRTVVQNDFDSKLAG